MPKLIGSPTTVGCAGSISKYADEYVGLVNTENAKVSITVVHSPAGWVGIGQYSDYHEYRIVLKGLLRVEHADGTMDVEPGQALDIPPEEWVRYSTPGNDGADYVTVCIPAFSLAGVHRDE